MSNGIIDIKKIAFVVILFLGIVSCSRIYGLDEQWVDVLNMLFRIMAVIIIAIAVMFFYRFILKHFLDWVDDNIDDGEKSSMYPLLSIVGTIIIVVAATIIILSIAGVQATAAVLGGGIVGLAISFGAQNTLSQFFNGIGLLMSRPFKSDDVVVLNNNGTKLRVLKIGMMNTKFKEWETGQIFSMPNNAVANSTIANMTSERGVYCMLIFFELALDVDFQKAKASIEASANRHPNVISDKPEYAALMEVENFRTNCAYIKLTVFLNDFERHGPICSEIRQNIIEDLEANDVNFARHLKYDVYVADLDGRPVSNMEKNNV